MNWKAKYTNVDYADKSTRLKRCFAWKPVYIAGSYYWLTSYEILQVYSITKHSAIIDDKESIFSIGRWINLSKRACK